MWLYCKKWYKSSLILVLGDSHLLNAFVTWTFPSRKGRCWFWEFYFVYSLQSMHSSDFFDEYSLKFFNGCGKFFHQHLLCIMLLFPLCFWRKTILSCRTLFNELRIIVEHIIMKPACPLFVRRLCLQSIAFISRLAPTVA